MESMEQRLLLHGGTEFTALDSDISSAAVVLRGDRLVIRGDKHANAIDIALSTSGDQIECRVDNLGPVMFSLAQIRSYDIRGGAGDDDISVSVNLPGKIRGNRGNDDIGGGPGAERIYGGPGNDTIDAGAGADIVWGGSGYDTFAPMDGVDKRKDFRAGRDIERVVQPLVNVIPIANPQTVTGTIDSPSTITLTGDDGDTNAQQILTFKVQSLPTSGTLRDSAGAAVAIGATLLAANLTYTPNAGFTGSDSFTFVVMDNGGTANGGQDTSSAGTIALTIPSNRVPTATPQTVGAALNTQATITLAGDDGEPNAEQTLTFRIRTLPTSGTLRDESGNAIAISTILSTASVRYVPNTDFTGSDSFTFVTVDNGGTNGGGQDTSSPATVSITVATANLRPIANAQTINAGRNTASNITLSGDDGDASQAQTLSFRVQSLPMHGTLRLASGGTNVTAGTLLTNPEMTFTPTTGFTGSDSFTFVVMDSGGTAGGGMDTSAPATISISITQPNSSFGTVTTGPFDAPSLMGIRTDQQTGAPAITQTHVEAAVNYTAHGSDPPTYGDHHGVVTSNQGTFLTPRPSGVYTTTQPDEDLVHNLEHGQVWISYNPTLLNATDRAALEELVRAGGSNTGVILTPRPKNSTAIALASWAHLLTLTEYNAGTIRDFIETNRGHSPEGFIPSGQRPTNSEPALDSFAHTPF